MNTVRMRHPDLPDQDFDAPESAVPMHRAAGWMPVGEEIAQPPAEDETGDSTAKTPKAEKPKTTSTRAGRAPATSEE